MNKKNNDWKKVEPIQADVWDYKKVPEVIGVLIDKRDNVGPNNSKMYTLEQPDGKLINVWGSTVLDSRMGIIPIGTEIRIVYLGLATSPKTKREYHNFEVWTR